MIRHLIITLALLMLAASAVQARKVNSRRGSMATQSSRHVSQPLDTVAAADSLVSFSGYDKPLRTTRETLFITNTISRRLLRVAFTIAYYDLPGRLIHKQSHNVAADVPAGESRRLTFPSWDRQQSFYYHRSRKPKVSGATPYGIAVKTDTLFFEP